MYKRTKNNLIYLATLALSISSISAMEKEITPSNQSQQLGYVATCFKYIGNLLTHEEPKTLEDQLLREQKTAEDDKRAMDKRYEVIKTKRLQRKITYEQELSIKIDDLLNSWSKKDLNKLIIGHERTKKYIIDDKIIAPLIRDTPRKGYIQKSYPAFNAQSFIIKTQYCEPSYLKITIPQWVEELILEVREKIVTIILRRINKIINAETSTTLQYDTINQQVLAQFECYIGEEEQLTKIGRTILNQKILTKLEYSNDYQDIAKVFQIIDPTHVPKTEDEPQDILDTFSDEESEQEEK